MSTHYDYYDSDSITSHYPFPTESSSLNTQTLTWMASSSHDLAIEEQVHVYSRNILPLPTFNISALLVAILFICAILLTLVIVSTCRRRRERSLTFLVVPYHSPPSTATPSLHRSQPCPSPSISSSFATSPLTETSNSGSKRSRSSIYKHPIGVLPYTFHIQNTSCPPSRATSSAESPPPSLPEPPPRSKPADRHRRPRRITGDDWVKKEKLLMVYGFRPQHDLDFLPRYQASPNSQPEQSTPDHRPPPDYQV